MDTRPKDHRRCNTCTGEVSIIQKDQENDRPFAYRHAPLRPPRDPTLQNEMQINREDPRSTVFLRGAGPMHSPREKRKKKSKLRPRMKASHIPGRKSLSPISGRKDPTFQEVRTSLGREEVLAFIGWNCPESLREAASYIPGRSYPTFN